MWEDAPQTALLNEILQQADVGGCEICSLFMVEKMWFFFIIFFRQQWRKWCWTEQEKGSEFQLFSQRKTSSGF